MLSLSLLQFFGKKKKIYSPTAAVEKKRGGGHEISYVVLSAQIVGRMLSVFLNFASNKKKKKGESKAVGLPQQSEHTRT